jgi:hypothetical protein
MAYAVYWREMASTIFPILVLVGVIFAIAWQSGREEDDTDPEILAAIEQTNLDKSIPLQHSTSFGVDLLNGSS